MVEDGLTKRMEETGGTSRVVRGGVSGPYHVHGRRGRCCRRRHFPVSRCWSYRDLQIPGEVIKLFVSDSLVSSSPGRTCEPVRGHFSVSGTGVV